MSGLRVLLLGATGGLGGAVLRCLAALTPRPGITALVRSADKFASRFGAAWASAHGVTVVQGDATDAVLLARLAGEHGALINTAGRPGEAGNDLAPIIDAVLTAAASLQAPRVLLLTGGMGVLDAPGGRTSGLLPLVPAVVQGYTRVHAITWEKVRALWGVSAIAFITPGIVHTANEQARR
jgi:uncharacterized protein YbjT (DUF2867 family)